MTEILINIFVIVMTFIIGLAIGYMMIAKNSFLAVENVNNWINDTKSNEWIQISLYNELEQKYHELDQEYSQYKGFVKAYNELIDKGAEKNE